MKHRNAGAISLALFLAMAAFGSDVAVWETKKYVANPILCDGDGPINQFRIWFRQFYADTETRSSKADQGPGGSLSKEELLTRISRRNTVVPSK